MNEQKILEGIMERMETIATNTDISLTMNAMIAAKVLTNNEIDEVFEAVIERLKIQSYTEDRINEVVTRIKLPILKIKQNLFNNKTI